MGRPSADAAAVAAATMASSLCGQLAGVTIDAHDGTAMHRAYMSAYREFLHEIASIAPLPEPDFGETD